MEPLELVERLAGTTIGATYNQYAGSRLLRTDSVPTSSLIAMRRSSSSARLPVTAEPGSAGFRSPRSAQLTGSGPAEATATIVHRVLAKLGLEDEVLLWNVVPTHPGSETSNRRPTRAEIQASAPFLPS